MATMNVSLPDDLKSFVDERTARGGFGSTSEYVRELIRRDRERSQLLALVMEGAHSETGALADEAYFASLRAHIDSAT